LCLVLNAIALVRCLKAGNLDALKCGGWGVFIAPTTKLAVWWMLLSHGAPDSPVCQPRHPTVRVRPLELLSSGSPDSPVVHRIGPIDCPVCRLARALTSARAAAHCSTFTAVADDRWRCSSRYPAGTPDSPVNYSGAAPRIPEGEQFGVEFPSVPDTVRCARPGHTSVVFCFLCLNPFLIFLLVYCEPLAPVKLIV
jgi:hypothetical protein